MREIQLTQNKVALVDDADYEWLSQFNWYAQKREATGFYAIRNLPRTAHGRGNIYMHKAIWGDVPDGYTIDHHNRNGLDNQRHNLRLATQSQQNQNQERRSDNTSGYTGVIWLKSHQKYKAQIWVNKKSIYLGLFDDPADAARVRDNAALDHYGEFARLNFPETS